MIEVYNFEDADGVEQGWTTQDPNEAKEYARDHGFRVIAHRFEWVDSELVTEWDFTEGSRQ